MAELVTNKLDFGGDDTYVLQDARVDSMYTNAQIDAMIPTVNDSTITIKQGTATKGTFTLNQNAPATITLDEGGSQIDTLGDIGDVNLVNLTDGQQIHWDADSQKWVNADGVEFRTLTQAQYDALPNSKLTDGVFYYITDSTDEEFIDDSVTSSVKTWSSEKIDGELDTIKTSLNNIETGFARMIKLDQNFSSIQEGLSYIASKVEAKMPYLIKFQASGAYVGYFMTYQTSASPNYAMAMITRYGGQSMKCNCVNGTWNTVSI